MYENFEELEEWRKSFQKPHNKIPDWVVNEVLELHFKDPSAPAWKIAEKMQGLVSDIKISRIRKEFALNPAKPL